MSLINSKYFFDLIQESLESGKISREHKCPFCGSMLDLDRQEGMKIRIGRLKFLLKEIEKNSDLAFKTLYNILFNREIYGGFDVPENSPKWWIELVHGIDNEERSPILIHTERNTKKIMKNRKNDKISEEGN